MIKKNIFHIAILLLSIISILFIISDKSYFANIYNVADKTPAVEIKNNIDQENSSNDIKEAPFYDDIYIEKIYLDDDDSDYSVKGGEFFRNGVKLDVKKDAEKANRILRLSLFYQWSKEDPLMFSSTLGAEALSESLEIVDKAQDRFFDLYETDVPVFASRFLKKFIESSESYKEFESEVSEKNAKELIIKSEDTLLVYSEEADSLRRIIKELSTGDNEEISKKKFAGLVADTYTTIAIIQNDLDLIEKNSESIGREVEERKKCLLESLGSCRRPMQNISEPEQPVNLQESPVPDLFTKAEANLIENINYGGPYKIKSPCWGSGDEQYLYVAKACRSHQKYCVEESYLATNIYFQMPDEMDPFGKRLLEKGIQAYIRPSSASYTCMNLEYQPKLATIDYFYTEFKNNRLFKNIKDGGSFKVNSGEFSEIIRNGELAENQFFDAEYPSEESLEYLGNYYRFTYAYLMKNSIGTNEERGEFLEKYLLIAEKLRDMDLVLNKIAQYFSFSLETLVLNKAIPNPIYMYPTRSNYPVFFLNFSPTAWRLGQKPQYLERDLSVEQKKELLKYSRTIDYETAISKYGKENLEGWTKIYNENIDKMNNDRLE